MASDQNFFIRGTLIEPDGTALGSATVYAYRLGGPQVAADLVDSTQYTADKFSATTDSNGLFTMTITHALAASAPLSYKVVLPDNKWFKLDIGLNDSSRTFDAGTLTVEANPPKKQEVNITSLVQKNMAEGHGSANQVVAAATGVTVIDSAVGDFHSTKVILDDVSVTVGNTTGVSFGGTKILDFTAGQILVHGAYAAGATFDLTDAGNVTPIDSADGGDIAYGTTVAGDGTLTGTDVDIVPSASIDPISGGAAAARLAAQATFDGTATAKDVYVNVLIDDADVADGASDVILVSDTLVINWSYQGDD